MKYVTLFKTIKRSMALFFANKEVTERYPDPIAKRILPRRSKGFLVLDIYKCTLCSDCEHICPSKSISLDELPTRMLNVPFSAFQQLSFSS